MTNSTRKEIVRLVQFYCKTFEVVHCASSYEMLIFSSTSPIFFRRAERKMPSIVCRVRIVQEQFLDMIKLIK